MTPPPSLLDQQVSVLLERVAFDLMERTNTPKSVAVWEQLTKKLAERISDLVEELCRDESVATVDRLGDDAAPGNE